MSSSGLIYAVIVGAWAAYLVPMWLRRQDELNEARPTERFSTAIRLLSGRAGMERRYAKELKQRDLAAEGPTPDVDPDAETEHLSSVDVRAFSRPRQDGSAPGAPGTRSGTGAEPAPARPAPGAAERARRGKVLARRRRVTTLLFAAFTLGAVVAAVGGVAFLWAPAVPALLLSAYIVHLRIQERRRFVYVMDRRRAEAAAARLRESRRPAPTPEPEADQAPRSRPRRRTGAPWSSRPTTRSGWTSSASAARSSATAGTRSPCPSPPTSPPRSPRAPPTASTSRTPRPGAPPAPPPRPTPPPPLPGPRQRTTPPRRTRDHGRTPSSTSTPTTTGPGRPTNDPGRGPATVPG
ncbi:hypothetical protein O1L60_15655 [Streptomyces diastatochromogenes]|nr:hypothetical protein [Streptomyces diastatochromogenes]